eukprot:TRINITY_DN65793_c0_g1_i1.p1 TRINITY_DN65793_c0_g1~~TRINITY_DN65793_c0_g1_i1.p1  ORF type:complete len:148 (+),score=15.63 TRINITY_DN65793_c0_g1_i1:91-534(+)
MASFGGSTGRPSTMSRVGSCSGLMTVAGSIVALPHSKRSLSTSSRCFDGESEAASKFKSSSLCFASMDRKPLQKYHPVASRSRMAQEDAPVPLKNASMLELHNKATVHKRRFVTTNQAYHTGAPKDTRTNPQMIADATKLERRFRDL